MAETVPEGWQHIAGGASGNAEFYVAEPGVIVVVPHDRSTDTKETARFSLQTQVEHWQSVGRPGAGIVLMDAILNQTAGARAVYRDESDTNWITCFGLVGGTTFGRAVASVFLGLSKPDVPTAFFKTLDDALAWARDHNAKRPGPGTA